MSTYGDLEAALVDALAGLQADDEPLFASVRARSPGERRAVPDPLARERKPAALVVCEGRDGAGHPTVGVWIACESLRGEAEAREQGAQPRLDAVTGVLHRATVGDWRLRLVGEECVSSDDRGVVWRQTYEAQPKAAGQPPLFGGAALCGAASDVDVEIESPVETAVVFGFPGLDGVFRQRLGTRGRTLVWRGTLRAEDDAALDVIEAAIEGAIRTGAAEVVTDGRGREHDECLPVAFERKAFRRRDSITGEAVQDFELVFQQLA